MSGRPEGLHYICRRRVRPGERRAGGDGREAVQPPYPARRGERGRSGTAGSEEAERVDVAEAPALAADAEVDPARCAAERLAGTDRLARSHRDARERRLGHAPAPAPHADRALACDPAREHDPAGAGRPHRTASRKVDAAVLAAREGIGAQVEEAGRRPRYGRRPREKQGEDQVHASEPMAGSAPGSPRGVNRCGLVRLSSRLGTDRWRLRPSARRRSRPLGGGGRRLRSAGGRRRSRPGRSPCVRGLRR